MNSELGMRNAEPTDCGFGIANLKAKRMGHRAKSIELESQRIENRGQMSEDRS